jgi:hypothetical protein
MDRKPYTFRVKDSLADALACGEETFTFQIEEQIEVTTEKSIDGNIVKVKNLLGELCISGSDVSFENGYEYYVVFEYFEGEFWFIAAYKSLDDFLTNYDKDISSQ